MKLKPILLQPVFVARKWGDPALLLDFHPGIPLETSPAGAVGESWDISSYPGADCVMVTGPMPGRPLSDLLAVEGKTVLGREWKGFNDFPVLQKFLAPRVDLPLQVHPGDEYARRVEGQNGKTECWYILDCPDDAFIWLGLRNVSSKTDFERVLGEGLLMQSMHKVRVRPGDVVYIPSGLLHGLGKGCVAYEVQQNSDVTYRLDDFGLGVDSVEERREHVRKALDVIDFSANCMPMKVAANWLDDDGFLDFPPYFGIGSIRCVEEGTLPRGGFCRGLTIISGSGELLAGGERLAVGRGQSWLLPAALKDVALRGTFHAIYTLFPK